MVRKFLIMILNFVLFTLVCSLSIGQNIYTYAGTGGIGFSGDGGQAMLATIDKPAGLFIDGSGNLYVSDITGNRIRKINTSGVINTIGGNGIAGSTGDGGPATSASLWNPDGITVDAAGNVYIADSFSNRIRKIDGSGTITTIAGTGNSSFGGDGGLATSAFLKYPVGVSLDGLGNIYVADRSNDRVRKIDLSGMISTIAGTVGNAYVGDGGSATSAQLWDPFSVKVDAVGNIYIADAGHHCIRKINTSGIITTIAGTGVAGYSGDGGSATLAKLNFPNDLLLDAIGNIYICDNCAIRKINTSGIITTIAGTGVPGYSGDGGPAILAQFNCPARIALDASGNIYVADVYNNRIRIICMSSCAMGIDDNKVSNEINIYPNPANDKLFLQNTNGAEVKKYLLHDITGKEIPLTQKEKGEFDVSTLPDGLYFLQVQTKNEVLTKKVLVQH